jgi:GNAT superfamily N-acetyltransferase
VRAANREDLDAINRIVGAAVMSWSLPERVRRLSVPLYRYTPVDLRHLEMVVAVSGREDVTGMAAWEPADATDSPGGRRALLLQGIHVDPCYHHRGVGRRLFQAAEQAACVGRYDGLLVKAQHEATGFFLAHGMCRLEVSDPRRQYANRLWKSLSG